MSLNLLRKVFSIFLRLLLTATEPTSRDTTVSGINEPTKTYGWGKVQTQAITCIFQSKRILAKPSCRLNGQAIPWRSISILSAKHTVCNYLANDDMWRRLDCNSKQPTCLFSFNTTMQEYTHSPGRIRCVIGTSACYDDLQEAKPRQSFRFTMSSHTC